MKIAIMCDVLGEPNNGTTIATMNLIEHLRKKGHQVIVVSCDESTRGKEGYVLVPKRIVGPLAKRTLNANKVELARPNKALINSIVKDVDAVHVQVPFIVGKAGIKSARKYGKPITASFHCQAENITAHLGKLMDNRMLSTATYKYFYRKAFRYCDKIHYPTQFIRDIFEKATKKTNGIVISNGVNSIFYQDHPAKRLSDKFTIICMGRLSNEKAQNVLLEALLLSKHKDDIKVVFAGDGPRKEEMLKFIKNEGLDCDINFYKREELVGLLRGADLYVHTARIEIESIACLEAIVSGLVPVICDSDRSATREFALDENNLYRDKDPLALAEKIDFWYENRELINEYKKKYEPLKKASSQEECMEKMEQMILSNIEEYKLKKKK